jgi:virulence-associated protein VagC
VEEGANIFGVFRVKITILRQKIIFFPIAKGGAKIFGVFRVKKHDFTLKNESQPTPNNMTNELMKDTTVTCTGTLKKA